VGINLHYSVTSDLFDYSTLLVLAQSNIVVIGALRVAVHLDWRLIIKVGLRVAVLGVQIILSVSMLKDPFVGGCHGAVPLS
jgi:hypothetical protein